MAEVLDFTCDKVDLKLQAGDDVVFTMTFDSDLTGWTGWAANCVDGAGVTFAFTIDASAQASRQITLRLTDTQMTQMVTGGFWQMSVLDNNGDSRTVVEGKVRVTSEARNIV